jgi:hypothetical protein
MINEKHDTINLSVSGGSDLNQELVENSDYTKSTPENEMMSNEVDSDSANNITDNLTDENDSSATAGQDDKEQENSESNEGSGIHVNDESYKVSDMHSRMNVEIENSPDGDSQPIQLQNDPTKNDLPYDVPDDQTPLMSDMPKNYEQYSRKHAPNQNEN